MHTHSPPPPPLSSCGPPSCLPIPVPLAMASTSALSANPPAELDAELGVGGLPNGPQRIKICLQSIAWTGDAPPISPSSLAPELANLGTMVVRCGATQFTLHITLPSRYHPRNANHTAAAIVLKPITVAASLWFAPHACALAQWHTRTRIRTRAPSRTLANAHPCSQELGEEVSSPPPQFTPHHTTQHTPTSDHTCATSSSLSLSPPPSHLPPVH